MAYKAYCDKRNNPKQKIGKQSIESLTKKGAALESVEISGENIGSFSKVARKYNIGFALQKDTSVNPPNWIVFFKAQDSKAFDSAFKEYSREVLKHKSPKPSLLAKLEKFKEIISLSDAPVKDRSRGEISL